MLSKARLNYPSQFAVVLGSMGLCLMLAGVLISGLGSALLHIPAKEVNHALSLPQNAGTARLLNTLASFISFFLPGWILARVLNPQPFRELGFSKAVSGKQVLLVILITFSCMVLSGALGELNEKIPLPSDWLAKARAMEASYKKATMAMAAMKTGYDLLLSILVLAVAPAFFEEVLFRGGFQPLLSGWMKSRTLGIVVTSILFSAIHFSYFGFLPRVALGIVLGLLFDISRNIWLNIFMHFLNNAFIVTQLYAAAKAGKSIEKTMDESMPLWWGLVALFLLFALFRNFTIETKQVLAAVPATDNTDKE
jgi:membrane protease YdiL (CAAX protease family)